MADENDLIVLNESRGLIYRMLSGLYFSELTVPQIEAIESFQADAFDVENEEMAQGLAMMQHYLRTFLGDTRQELACDFAHTILAIGAQNKRMALPYESVFTTKEGLLMQDSRDDVYLTFLREGVSLAQGTDLPEDHLSFMFEFIAILCDRFSDLLREGKHSEALRVLQTQSSFIANHIENWMDNYADALESSARTEFYRGLGRFTHGWEVLDAGFRTDLEAALSQEAK